MRVPGGPALLVTLMTWGVTGLTGQDDRLRQRLDPAALPAVLAQIDSAAQAGLPVEPLIQKALEGQARGAPAPRILAAVRSLRQNLGTAVRALGVATEAELTAAVSALNVGVDSTVLAALGSARDGDEPLAMSLVVLADLVQRGVPADTASRVIISLTQARVDERGMASFRQLVERDILSGAAPAAAASIRARGVIISITRRRGVTGPAGDASGGGR